MKKKEKRHKYSIVDRSLQYKFLAIILIYSAAIVCFFAISLIVPDILNMINKNLSAEMRAAAAQRIHSLHYRLWPGVIALMCLVGIHSMRIFHRLVGALYKFRLAFLKISKGDLSFRVMLRKKDYLHREKAMFNEMIGVFTEKWGSMQIAVQDALKSLGVLEQAVKEKSEWRDADQQLLQMHRQYLEVLADHAQYFQPKEGEKQEQDREGQ